MNNEPEKTLKQRLWEILGRDLEEGLQARTADEIIEDFLDAGVDLRPSLESVTRFENLSVEERQKLSEADFRDPLKRPWEKATERVRPIDLDGAESWQGVPVFLLGTFSDFKRLHSSSVYMDGDEEAETGVFTLEFESVLQPEQLDQLPKWVGDSLRIARAVSREGYEYCAEVHVHNDEGSSTKQLCVILKLEDGSYYESVLTPERPVRIFPEAKPVFSGRNIQILVRIEQREDVD
jgi:hypothetical protein